MTPFPPSPISRIRSTGYGGSVRLLYKSRSSWRIRVWSLRMRCVCFRVGLAEGLGEGFGAAVGAAAIGVGVGACGGPGGFGGTDIEIHVNVNTQ